MRKIILLICCLLLITSLFLAACGNGGKQDNGPSEPGITTNATDTEEPFSGLDVEEEVTIPIEENEGIGGL